MRAGETDKSIAIIEPKIVELIEDLLKVTQLKGMIDIDIFEKNGDYYISEINPRFGGGYLHGHEVGVNTVKLIIENTLFNRAVGKYTTNYGAGSIMMKYNEVMIL